MSMLASLRATTQSYRYFMWEHLFTPAGMKPEQVHFPDAHFEDRIAGAGGIDLQILGIGSNGHIAFNEPGSAHDTRTRTVQLAPQTIHDNARFFDRAEDVPKEAVTMGIGTILDARRILLLATGEAKAPAVAAALEGPVTRGRSGLFPADARGRARAAGQGGRKPPLLPLPDNTVILILRPNTKETSPRYGLLMRYLNSLSGITYQIRHVQGVGQRLTEIYLLGDTAPLSKDFMASLPCRGARRARPGKIPRTRPSRCGGFSPPFRLQRRDL